MEDGFTEDGFMRGRRYGGRRYGGVGVIPGLSRILCKSIKLSPKNNRDAIANRANASFQGKRMSISVNLHRRSKLEGCFL